VLPRLDRLRDDVPEQAEPAAGLEHAPDLRDGWLGVEPLPGIGDHDRVERSVIQW
jgi:hypothetical protein